SAFIPLYKKYLLENTDKAETFKWCIFLLFVIMSSFLFIVLYLFSGFWVDVLAPGKNESTRLISINLLKIMALCCPFYLCSALMNYVSMAHNDFKPMSMRNPVQNIGMLIGVFIAYYFEKVEFLAWGFTGSYIYFFMWSLVRKDSKKIIMLPAKFEYVEIKGVIGDFWSILKPLLLLPLLLQGNITLERALSSLVSLEAVSSLDYAKFVTETVVFFLSVPVAFAGLSAWVGLDTNIVKRKLEELYTILIVL
ncbi:lipid II flippase MurJ, partial [Klebsiella pneumoniae]|uniref:lipid II flippase MurJ n=1 Tax=Klebsiella pneumoniae TaxID=573 RepID=UPI00286E6EE8